MTKINKFAACIILTIALMPGAVFSQNVLSTDSRPSYDNVNTFDKYGKPVTAACGTPFLSTGYPAWTNFYAGWMLNIINKTACPVVISGFEARFQGTSGYQIYTKPGTFVGFEGIPGAWTLLGTVASLTGISTTAPTPIPIPISVVIPAGATQGFYLTRTDNNIPNRHLYISGTGTAGTTIYASDANLSLTEAKYLDVFFSLQVGVRRPSIDVCYTVNCALPIELVSFDGMYANGSNLIKWVTASELNNDYFVLEKSTDGFEWSGLARIDGAGTSMNYRAYSYTDGDVKEISYYRLAQVDYDGSTEISNIISVIASIKKYVVKSVKRCNLMGQEIDTNQPGMYLEITEYENSEIYIKKKIQY